MSTYDGCSHVFSYSSVIPPSHCPLCGACLQPYAPQPMYPQPVYPQPWLQPYPQPWTPGHPWYYTFNTNNTGTTGTRIDIR